MHKKSRKFKVIRTIRTMFEIYCSQCWKTMASYRRILI